MDLSDHNVQLPQYSGLSSIDSKPPPFSSHEDLVKPPLPDQEKGEPLIDQEFPGSHPRSHRVVAALLVAACFCVGAVVFTLLISLTVTNWSFLSLGPCSAEESAVVGQIEGFYGEGVKKVRIINNGDVVLAPEEQGPKITTRTMVYAATKEEALEMPYKLSHGDTHFYLEYPLSLGGCPRQDTQVNLLDDTGYGPVSFEAVSISGSILMSAPFNNLHFTNYVAETSHGDLKLERATISHKAKLLTSAGNIKVVSSTSSQELNIKTNSGDVILRDIQTSKLKVRVDAGGIQVSQLTLRPGIFNCRAKIQTTSGAIQMNDFIFPAGGFCLVEVGSVSGDVEVHLGPGFSGTLLVQSKEGEATIQGSPCHEKTCKAVINPELESGHVVVITSFVGKVSVTH